MSEETAKEISHAIEDNQKPKKISTMNREATNKLPRRRRLDLLAWLLDRETVDLKEAAGL